MERGFWNILVPADGPQVEPDSARSRLDRSVVTSLNGEGHWLVGTHVLERIVTKMWWLVF